MTSLEAKMQQTEQGEDWRQWDQEAPRTKAQKECVDFLGAFGKRIMPTNIRLLERNDHLLLIRHYGWGEEISPTHDRLFRTLVRYGNNPDAPGSITVICLWGIAATKHMVGTERSMRVYTWTGVGDTEATSDGAIKAALSKWFRDCDHPPV